MEKIIEKHLRITSANRCIEKIYHEIYSHDKGTAVFKFTAEGLTASKVICLFYFKETKRYRTVEATIEGNTITVPFDSTSIIADESVIGYIYFEKVEQSTDVYAFAFNVWLSAIDKARKVPLVERTTGRVVDVESIVTKQELDELFAKIKAQGGTYDDSNLRAELSNKADRTEIERISGQLSILEQKTDKDTVYDDEPLKRRILALESKPEFDTSSLVTEQKLESKGYLTEHQPLTEYAKKTELPQPYNDTELKERVSRLESKPEINTSELVTKQELENKGYLTQHQPLTEYAKKVELPQPYNDTEVKARIQTLETKAKTVGIPQKLSIAGNVVTLSDGGGSITLPTTAATPGGTPGQVSEYEIHGTGMPNGKVTAPIGTTYVDTAVTNGALKWIKQSGTGNTGWKVLIGDTGWRTLNSVSRVGNSFIKIRRVNNFVTYQFGGLQWGWFGVVRRNGPGFVRHNSSGDKGAKLTYPNGIPEGFRSENSLVGPTYDDKGRPYGIWYLGGKSDLNFIQFTFNDPIPTDRDIGDIRVSAISYLTDEDWPTTLP